MIAHVRLSSLSIQLCVLLGLFGIFLNEAAFAGPGGKRVWGMVEPIAASVLAGPSQRFVWVDSKAGAGQWRILAGSKRGARNFHDGRKRVVRGTEMTLAGLPVDGSPVFVRLGHRVNGSWRYKDYAYTAARGTASGGSALPPDFLANPANVQNGTLTTQSTVIMAPNDAGTTLVVVPSGGGNGGNGTDGSSGGLVIVTQLSPIEAALSSGDASGVTEAEILAEAANALAQAQNKRRQGIIDLFRLDPNGQATADSITGIDWDPSQDSVWFDLNSVEQTFPVLVANAAAKISASEQKNLAVAGISPSNRYIALGANPFHDFKRTSQPGGAGNARLQAFLENALAWVTQRRSLKTGSVRVVIAQLPDSTSYPQDGTTDQWFRESFPDASVNEPDACESAQLADCLQTADLLVIGRDDGSEDNHGVPFDLSATLDAVKAAARRGVPVVYVQHGGGQSDLGNGLTDFLGLRTNNNYVHQEMLANADPTSLLTSDTLSPLAISLDRLRQRDLPADLLIGCQGDISTLKDCQDSRYLSAFGNGLNLLRTTLRGLAARNVDLFGNDGNRLLKLLVLLGDKYRLGDAETAAIQYPIDLNDLDAAGRAAFAEATVSYSRVANKAQPNP